MNFGPEDSKLLHFWQSLHFECETDREDVVGLSSKVDNLRSLMQQIDCLYARWIDCLFVMFCFSKWFFITCFFVRFCTLVNSSTVTSTSRDDLLHECSEKYRQLVDEQDTTKGLHDSYFISHITNNHNIVDDLDNLLFKLLAWVLFILLGHCFSLFVFVYLSVISTRSDCVICVAWIFSVIPETFWISMINDPLVPWSWCHCLYWFSSVRSAVIRTCLYVSMLQV